MKVLHINYSDRGGGAEEFALSLMNSQSDSKLLVKTKQTSDDRVVEIPKNKRYFILNILDKLLWKLGVKISFRSYFGFQNRFHGTYSMLSALEDYKKADIIHLHNIHGEYFDLKALRRIAKEKPIIWTSHDMWINTGGEGGLPAGLSDKERRKLYPLKGGIFDERRKQLKTKKSILSDSDNIHIVGPSNDHVNKIRLCHPDVKISRIYNGVDTRIFNAIPIAKKTMNQLPQILIFISNSPYKSTKMVLSLLKKITTPFELHVIGNQLNDKCFEKVHNHGYISNRNIIADLFKKIDIGVFYSKAETFGLLPAELAACGGKIFLNKSLPVFYEHKEIYDATLFEGEDDLISLLGKSIANLEVTKQEGKKASTLIQVHFNRAESFNAYSQLYREAVKSNKLREYL